jgi:VanZ family protein
MTALHYVEHFAAYFLTSIVLIPAYQKTVRSLLLCIGLVIYAGLLETAQLWVPGRAARITDFIASSIGILAGITFVFFIQWIWCRRTNSIR